MELLCVGLSHKSAPLAVRERLALTLAQQSELLQRLSDGATEAMVVSTCNRVEVYLTGATEKTEQAVRAHISLLGGADALEHLYQQRGDAALVHLFRVAASLDSMVVGEPQILGQVKDAYELAQKMGAARTELARSCQAAFGSAKRVRSETAVGRAATSMASAAVELAKKIFGSLSGASVLIVGAGEMAELAAKHMQSAGAQKLMVTNRTLDRAVELAAIVQGVAHPFEDMNALLVQADVVVSSTASPTPIFTREKIVSVLKARRYRRLLMVDLAVPRDIAPDVNTLENVYTADVDDIQEMVAENSAVRAAEATKAEAIVAEEVARFVQAKAVRDGVPVLAQLRARGEQIARAEVERTLAHLGELTDRQRRSIEAMASAIVNKLLHQPTAKLRAVGVQEPGNPLVGAAAELFGLEKPGGMETDETDSNRNPEEPAGAVAGALRR